MPLQYCSFMPFSNNLLCIGRCVLPSVGPWELTIMSFFEFFKLFLTLATKKPDFLHSNISPRLLMAMASSSSSSSFIFLIFMVSCTISCLNTTSSAHGSNVQFNFTGFSLTDGYYFNFNPDSNIQLKALQVTYDTGSRDIAILNASGQITYTTPLRLWDGKHNYSASFNTSFLINMGPTQDGGKNITGGGMAFILSSQPAQDVPNGYGAGLGLVDPSNPSLPNDSRFVAIEFDTFYDPAFDPHNANHVGIDVNSVKSVVTKDLDAYNINLNQNITDKGTNTCVWIDYDGHAKAFDIFLANQVSDSEVPKPKVPVISRYPVELDRILPENVYLGFSASTGTIKETHCVLQWHFNSTGFPPEKTNKTLIIGLSVGLSIALLLTASMAILCIIKKRKVKPDLLEDLRGLSYGPRRFSYRELKKATNSFSEENKLGEGGFGSVYRGKLGSINTEIAVKCLSSKSTQGKREFIAEIRSIGRMRHKNLVQLLGWSYDDWHRKLLLVYEYMPHGSLDRWLLSAGSRHSRHSSTDPHLFSWERRYNVLRGVAAGLHYLHEEWEMVVIHRDLKPSNVMLDEDFNARLGDFGLAKLIRNQNPNRNQLDGDGQSIQTNSIAGTLGYMAPECLEAGVITKESDVYSFGAVAMEVVTGKKLSAQNLLRLWKIKAEGGNLLNSEYAEENGTIIGYGSSHGSLEREQMEMVLWMSLTCCHPDPSCRPTVRQIVNALSSANGDDGDGDLNLSTAVTSEQIHRYMNCLSESTQSNRAPDQSASYSSASASFQAAMDSSISLPSLTGR